jgi:hypothetical protein
MECNCYFVAVPDSTPSSRKKMVHGLGRNLNQDAARRTSAILLRDMHRTSGL